MLLLLLAYTITISLSQETCLFTQPHITLGSKFAFKGANTNKNGIFTIALVSRGNCENSQPRVFLSSGIEKISIKSPLAYSYGVDNL